MNKIIKVDISIIGGGAGGLSVAAGAAQMGASVALIEAEKMGGDCLNYGCVPSKSLLAAAKPGRVGTFFVPTRCKAPVFDQILISSDVKY